MRSRLRVKKLSVKVPPRRETSHAGAGAGRHPAARPEGAHALIAERVGEGVVAGAEPLAERALRFVDLRGDNGEVGRDEVISGLLREGRVDAEALVDQLVPGDRVGDYLVIPPPPPPLKEVIELTEANYFRAYRWTTGRSRFPLEEFLKIIVAKRADIYTAIAWAEEWTGCRFTDPIE